MKKAHKSRIEYFFFQAFLKIFGLFPYRLVEKFLIHLFRFGGMRLKIRYQVAYKNLQKVFPDKSKAQLQQIMREMYAEIGRTAAETYFGDTAELLQNCEIDGYQHLAAALSGGKGAILATLHMGNWELAGIKFAQDNKVSVIYKNQRNKYFNQYTNRLRKKQNIVLIEKKKALRAILKLLKENYIVAILMDQNAGKNGILTNFLGHPASTFVGTAKIAAKQNCPIVPAVALRDKNGRNRIIIEAAISTENVGSSDREIKQLTEAVSERLEKYIIAHPSQWFWVHKRWKGAGKAKIV
ncbi:MAG: lysophospholipid acyltransferase family protein [Candidatus Cloacimonadales bacterium]